MGRDVFVRVGIKDRVPGGKYAGHRARVFDPYIHTCRPAGTTGPTDPPLRPNNYASSLSVS